MDLDGKGKNKQQAPAYSLKKDDNDEMDQGDGEPMIGPKLPPEYEVRSSQTEILHLSRFRKRFPKNIHLLHPIWMIQRIVKC